MVVDWHGNICRGLSRTCPAPASWGRETSAPRTPCESGRKSTWVRREEGSWWIVDTNVRVSIIHPSLMVSSILRASFRYCFSACVTNSNIISLTTSLYTTSHLSLPHPITPSPSSPPLTPPASAGPVSHPNWPPCSGSQCHVLSDTSQVLPTQGTYMTVDS